MNENQQTQSHSYILPASILLAAILVAGALVYSTGSKGVSDKKDNDNNNNNVDVAKALAEASKDSVVLGDPDALVKIFEFSDFQCPFCGKFHQETGTKLREEYVKTGKVSMIYLDLAFLGPESSQAALAARCAGEQGKFWIYHDTLFDYLWDNYYSQGKNGENVGGYSDENLKKFAVDLSLDAAKFNQCLDSKKYISAVDANRQAAEVLLGDRLSTPSVFINDQLIQGAQPYEVFKAAIDQQLNK